MHVQGDQLPDSEVGDTFKEILVSASLMLINADIITFVILVE